VVYLPESKFSSLGEVFVVDEYFDVVNVKRPYSLEVGIFNGIVEFNFRSSVILIHITKYFLQQQKKYNTVDDYFQL
jgi:hypothetical protein